VIVLDTNVISELMRPMPSPQVQSWLTRVTEELLVTTVITVAEIEYGIARLPDGKRREGLALRFAELTGPTFDLTILPFDEPAARLAGHLRYTRERQGLDVQFADMMIAAIALNMNATLATRNVGDFAAISLHVIHPWEAD
jgi:predicted nucleic acid-binding protein